MMYVAMLGMNYDIIKQWTRTCDLLAAPSCGYPITTPISSVFLIIQLFICSCCLSRHHQIKLQVRLNTTTNYLAISVPWKVFYPWDCSKCLQIPNPSFFSSPIFYSSFLLPDCARIWAIVSIKCGDGLEKKGKLLKWLMVELLSIDIWHRHYDIVTE